MDYDGKPEFPYVFFAAKFVRELEQVKKEYLAEMRIVTGVPVLATFKEAYSYGRELQFPSISVFLQLFS